MKYVLIFIFILVEVAGILAMKSQSQQSIDPSGSTRQSSSSEESWAASELQELEDIPEEPVIKDYLITMRERYTGDNLPTLIALPGRLERIISYPQYGQISTWLGGYALKYDAFAHFKDEDTFEVKLWDQENARIKVRITIFRQEPSAIKR